MALIVLPRPVIWLSAAAFFASLSLIAMKFVALYLAVNFGTSVAEIGRILAFYGVGSIIGAFGGGHLMERLGSRAVLTGSLLLLAPALAALAAVPASLIPLALFVIGILQSAFRPAYNGAILRVCAPEDHSRAYSAYLTAMNVGGAIAAAAGGILATYDFRLIFLFSAFPPVLSALFAWLALSGTAIDRPAAATGKSHGSRESSGPLAVLRDRPFLALCLIELFCAFLIAQLFSTYPIYLKDEYGISPEGFGYLLTASSLLVAALSLPVTTLAGKYRDDATTVLALLLFFGGFAVLPLSDATGFAVATMVVWTMGEILLWPVLMKLVMQRAALGASGTYLGAYHSIFSISHIVSPVIGTLLYSALGGDVLWLISGGLGILAVIIVMLFALGREAPSLSPLGAPSNE